MSNQSFLQIKEFNKKVVNAQLDADKQRASPDNSCQAGNALANDFQLRDCTDVDLGVQYTSPLEHQFAILNQGIRWNPPIFLSSDSSSCSSHSPSDLDDYHHQDDEAASPARSPALLPSPPPPVHAPHPLYLEAAQPISPAPATPAPVGSERPHPQAGGPQPSAAEQRRGSVGPFELPPTASALSVTDMDPFHFDWPHW
jgi:hypothetical protein